MTLPSQLLNGYPGAYQGRQIFNGIQCDVWVKTPTQGVSLIFYWAAGTSNLAGFKFDASILGDVTVTISAWQVGAPDSGNFGIPKGCQKKNMMRRSANSGLVPFSKLYGLSS
jgi:hypothetical protein